MINSMLRYTAIMSLTAGILSGCITAKDRTGIFLRTAENDGRIVTDSQFYQGVTPLRILFHDSREAEEYVLYRGQQGQSEMLFASTSPMNAPNTALDFDKLIADSVRMFRFNQGQDLAFGESQSIKTNIAATWVQPFTQGKSGRQCIGFSSRWDMRPDDPEYRPSKIMFGYHCAPAGRPLKLEDGISFVHSIDIRGITVRHQNLTAYDIQNSRSKAPVRDIQVANLVLAQDGGGGGGIAGLPAFPLLIARTFRDLDGPCVQC